VATPPKRPRVASPPEGAPASAGELKPPRWARVERIRLFRREVRETLDMAALDLLLAEADVVVEGEGVIGSDTQRDRVLATVMLTIDLHRVADRFREPADAATAERVAELLRVEPTLHERLIALARPRLAKLAKLADDALEISIEPHVRVDGMHVLVDVDAVGWAGPRRRRTDPGGGARS
jgi:hypothetical protein